ncbi:hypothetical protein [Neobacillus niacini]|uniref:hypothetical protein n=1 Tax=Neobacillus niacini TaxID=86668 RepID=UPI00398378C0
MKRYKLIKNYKGIHKKGTIFYLIAESEFIGVKEFVLQTKKINGKIILSEKEMRDYFRQL